MTNYFIVPGLGNSGEGHWQTYFEKSAANFKRIEQEEGIRQKLQIGLKILARPLPVTIPKRLS